MTLAMDIRLSVPNAKLGFVFAGRGIIPEGCSSWFLPRIVGISKALEWCYSVRVFRSASRPTRGKEFRRSWKNANRISPIALARICRRFFRGGGIARFASYENAG